MPVMRCASRSFIEQRAQPAELGGNAHARASRPRSRRPSRSRSRPSGTSSSCVAFGHDGARRRGARSPRGRCRAARLEGDHRAVARERQHDGHGRALDLGAGADARPPRSSTARSVRPATSRAERRDDGGREAEPRDADRGRRGAAGRLVQLASPSARGRFAGSSFSPSKVRSRKTIPVHTTSMLVGRRGSREQRGQLALPAGVGVEDPPRGVDRRHERVQRERLDGELARARDARPRSSCARRP